jgi:hypothetical protein
VPEPEHTEQPAIALPEVHMTPIRLIATLGLLLLAASPAAAFGRHSEEGDSYENDMQRNPRLIEPGGEEGRYRAYYGREGWDERQEAARSAPRGRIDVAPYPGRR